MHDVISPEAREVIARADAIVKRADSGDLDALIVTRKIFDELPTMWDAYGNLAAAAERAIVELFAGESALTREALRKKLAAMRAELGGPEVSPLERLLAQRVVACWLLSYHADFAYARALKQHPVKEVEPYHRRQDRSARQYLKALKSLAVIRRLLVPQVQVNIGERQVNIATGQVNVGAPAHQPEPSLPHRGIADSPEQDRGPVGSRHERRQESSNSGQATAERCARRGGAIAASQVGSNRLCRLSTARGLTGTPCALPPT